MSNMRPVIWIITSLLLLNVIGTVVILLKITEPEKESNTAKRADSIMQNESINRIESVHEKKPDLPVQVNSYVEPVAKKLNTPEELSSDQTATEIIVARVNNTNINQSLLISYLNQLAPPESLTEWKTLNDVPNNILMQSINNAALDNLLVQLAIEMKLDQEQVIQANIARSNRNILKSAFLNQLAPNLVSNNDITSQYETLVASLEGKLEYRARHILLANEKEAKIVNKALEEKKKSFDELAKLFSLDETTGLRGGDLGYVLAGQLNPEFEKVINDLEIGQRSKPFETEFGWHIAIVDDRRDSQPMTFTQATPIIRQKLEQQAIQKYLSELLDSAIIEVLIEPNASAASLSSTNTNSVE